jgi:polyisoprenyl-teichoic acid--peptidoglycan teichoic acid transferase
MRNDKRAEDIQKENQVPVRKRKKRKWLRNLLILVTAGVLGLGAYDSLAAIHFFQKTNQNTFTPVGNNVQVDSWQGTERVNILVMGVDNRNQDEHPRSDSMILVSVDPQTKKADILSILRDTYVSIPGQGQDKINAAFAYGGPDLAVRTVKNFLQVPINYYMVTDFQGFEKVIDAIGGVTIDVEKDMVYQDDGVYDINLKKGVQHLDGKHALMYVRFRHDALSDYARTERQRKLLKAIAAEMKTPSMLIKLPSILQAAEPYIQTNLGPDDILKLAGLFAKVDTSQIQTAQVPASDSLQEGQSPDGESILIPNVTAARQLVHSLIGEGEAGSQSSGQTESGKQSSVSADSGQQVQADGSSSDSRSDTSGNQGRSMVVTGVYVNVRRGPGLDQPIIGKVYQGDMVQVVSSTANGWSQVILPDGTQGYVASQFLQAQ